SLGISGWRDDVRTAIDMSRVFDPTTRAGMAYFIHGVAIPHGVWLPDSAIVHETGQILEVASAPATTSHWTWCGPPMGSHFCIAAIRSGTGARVCLRRCETRRCTIGTHSRRCNSSTARSQEPKLI